MPAARQPIGQRGGLLVCARLLQAFEQAQLRYRPDLKAPPGIEGDAGGGIAAQQRGDPVLRACLPQHAEQADNVRVVEGGVGRGAIGKHGSLPACARLQQAFQQPGRSARVIDGDAGGRITVQQRNDLVLRARRPQAFQQRSHGGRVVEEGARR